MKTAFIFSGQGSQGVGMGMELYENFEEYKETFDIADNSLEFSLKELCFKENELLNLTKYAQPAILAMSAGILSILEKTNIKPDYLAGLSLGEYSAIVASGAMDVSEAVKLVHNRGIFMEEACPTGFGAMSAVMGLSKELTLEACTEASKEDKRVYVANFNTLGQIVVSGETSAVALCEEICIKKGAKRAIRLNVSGPFHTPYLDSAAIKLSGEIDKINIKDMKTPVITNVTAREINNSKNIKETLVKQVTSAVKWDETIEHLISKGVNTFIEIGPGKALCSFVKKINKEVKCFNIEDMKSYEKLMDDFGKKDI